MSISPGNQECCSRTRRSTALSSKVCHPNLATAGKRCIKSLDCIQLKISLNGIASRLLIGQDDGDTYVCVPVEYLCLSAGIFGDILKGRSF